MFICSFKQLLFHTCVPSIAQFSSIVHVNPAVRDNQRPLILSSHKKRWKRLHSHCNLHCNFFFFLVISRLRLNRHTNQAERCNFCSLLWDVIARVFPRTHCASCLKDTPKKQFYWLELAEAQSEGAVVLIII